LRIDVSGSWALLVIIRALPGFHARYPDIQIGLGVTERAVDLIGENDEVIRSSALQDSPSHPTAVGAQVGVAPVFSRRRESAPALRLMVKIPNRICRDGGAS
jgi:DNA-binding transcriptional LysR family regulator